LLDLFNIKEWPTGEQSDGSYILLCLRFCTPTTLLQSGWLGRTRWAEVVHGTVSR